MWHSPRPRAEAVPDVQRRCNVTARARRRHLRMNEHLAPRRILSFPAFAAYRSALAAWLEGSATDETELYHTSGALGLQFREAGFFAEHVLAEVHALGMNPDGWSNVHSERRRARDRRYRLALTLLLQSSFGTDPALRSVRGTDGREWIVLFVRENVRWDPRIDVPRKDWLSCIARDQRRYITPVPLGWERWSDGELLAQILRARPDLRGPA